MRAIVLAGGEGTRLRPLTQHTPKQLAPVGGRPLLTRMLDHLREGGIDRITLALTRSESSAAVHAHYGDGSALSVDLNYSFEETPLGSGGAIAQAAQGWSDRFLVCNGDIVTDVDLSLMVEAHESSEAELTIMLYEVADPSPFGVVALDAGGRIERFVEKPPAGTEPSRLVNAGFWLFEPSLLAELDATRPNRVEDELFPALAASGRAIRGFHPQAYWRDIGDPEAYRQTNLELLAAADADDLRGADCRVEPGARIANSVLGARCMIASGATVEDSVLWEGVMAGANAHIRRSVLADGVRVGDGAVVDGAVAGHGAVIEAGARIPPGTSLEPDAAYAVAGGG